jgi:hypothetical protein
MCEYGVYGVYGVEKDTYRYMCMYEYEYAGMGWEKYVRAE